MKAISETQELSSIEGPRCSPQWLIIHPTGETMLLRIKQPSGTKTRDVTEAEARHWCGEAYDETVKLMPLHGSLTITPTTEAVREWKKLAALASFTGEVSNELR